MVFVSPHKQLVDTPVTKRILDVLVATISLVGLSPLMAVIAVLVKISSKGPVLYHWHVIGQHGRAFRSYKFRSMIVGAEALKARLLHLNEMNGPVFKVTDDPRTTTIGKILRKFSLDELPQLWSVLKGDMSLVGPRPVAPHEWVEFEDWQRRKLSVRPGMICLWHVNGKPKDFEQWIKMDLEYIDNWSFWLDLKILWRGIAYIARGQSS